MSKPMSWKWKLGLGIVGGIFVGVIFVFTPYGQTWMMERINESLEATPESERRTGPEAQRWLTLAWWRGNVLLDDQGAMEMYREFLGLGKNKDGEDVFSNGKLDGRKVTPDGLKGWGPMHPDAPDAYWFYLQHYNTHHSSHKTSIEAWNYYRLFYTWMLNYSPEGKPHPKFKKYWNRVRELGIKRGGVPSDITDQRASMADDWKEPVEGAPPVPAP